ncbi:hypothetical protein AO826_05255 [Xanthomonas phaseoli pv. manihotis]|nr:hypothetical protein AO826_05255 [Xanthomonas phaseoli pv. manihotis]
MSTLATHLPAKDQGLYRHELLSRRVRMAFAMRRQPLRR